MVSSLKKVYHIRQLVTIMTQMLSSKQLQTLLSSRVFSGVDAAWLSQVLKQAMEDGQCFCRQYRRSDLIYAGRHFDRALGVLLSGRIRVLRTALDGHQLSVSTQLPGAAFGMAVLFSQAEEFATQLHCETSCEVLFLREAFLRKLMQQEFTIAENYIRYLSSRIAFLNSKIAGLSAGDSVHKLAQWLLERAQDNLVSPLPPMARLASELNLSRASLYRAMDTLEQSGAIRRDGKTILLLSPAHLQGMDSDDALD